MRKRALAKQLARRTGLTNGEAADQVDRTVTEILQKLRSGQHAELPGFGRFQTSESGTIEFKQDLPYEKP